MNSHNSRRWHEGLRKTSDERQYLITPLLGHQITDEYMKKIYEERENVNQKPRDRERLYNVTTWTNMWRLCVFYRTRVKTATDFQPSGKKTIKYSVCCKTSIQSRAPVEHRVCFSGLRVVTSDTVPCSRAPQPWQGGGLPPHQLSVHLPILEQRERESNQLRLVCPKYSPAEFSDWGK